MFNELIENAVGLSDAALDEAIRASELTLRAQQARHAALLAVADARGLHRADGHHSMSGYLRATVNASPAEIARQRLIADVTNLIPSIGEALAGGHVGISQVLQIARIHTNPRTREYLAPVVDIYLERAEQLPLSQLRREIDQFLLFADQDGSFDELASAVEHRSASVNDNAGGAHVVASGGDPVTAARMVAIFESFVQREFERDTNDRRAEHGDDAHAHPLPRSARQRRFDALARIFAWAAAAPPPDGHHVDTVVNILIDQRTTDELFTRAGVLMPNGYQLDLDDIGEATIDAVLSAAADDPSGWVDRRCETDTGQPIHPLLVLQAAMTGHVRRVVVDSQGVVVDQGRRQRLFVGAPREAAKLLIRHCEHPGCTVPSRFAQVDHLDEWHDGGRTDQHNRGVKCDGHNVFKHHRRWRTIRDGTGRPTTVRADGTMVLPVGARPPDLSFDELSRITRSRVQALCRA